MGNPYADVLAYAQEHIDDFAGAEVSEGELVVWFGRHVERHHSELMSVVAGRLTLRVEAGAPPRPDRRAFRDAKDRVTALLLSGPVPGVHAVGEGRDGGGEPTIVVHVADAATAAWVVELCRPDVVTPVVLPGRPVLR